MTSVPRSLTRFLLEAGFLVLVAVAAGLAQLNAPTIVLLVAAVWGVMALVERLASRTTPMEPTRRVATREPEPRPESGRPPAPARVARAGNGFQARRRTWEWGSVVSEETPARHVRVLPPEEEAAAEDEETGTVKREEKPAAEVIAVPSAPEPGPEPKGVEEAEPQAEVPVPEPVPMPPAEPPAPPEPAPEPHRPPTPEPSPPPIPVPHEPRTPEPSPPPQPTRIPQPPPPPPTPVPEPPPAAERESELEPQRVVPLVPRASVGPQQWNLWELERGTRELLGADPARDEERGFLILYLRQFANADGVLPPEFDEVVRESFADVIAFVQQR